ncbi:hypothetical protein ACKKBG_A25060 [Auxenochlorella protothecoides x Auxenochlorella symbiontica]
MRFTAKVKVEQGDASGSFVAAQPPKETMVELCRDASGLHTLVLHTKPRPLALPCKAPLVLYGGSAAQGRLGMRFLAVKTEAWRSVPRCVQLTLTSADAAALCGLRDRLHACLGGGPVKASGHVPLPTGSKTSVQPPRRPLAARDLNVTVSEPRPAPSLASTCFFGGGQVKPRPAASGSRPASSAVSSGSRRSAASRPCQDVTDLSPEQQRAVALVRAGKNVFFTGCAGTGKSRLLAAIMSVLPPSTTFVTASTGLAACALGGTTIHAFAGVGRAEGGIDAMAARAGLGESAQRWRRAAALIIDEISMLDAHLFTALEELARRLRGSQAPFGGIQLILSGDFHQLPPVTRGSGRRAFCFQSPAWERCVQASVVLSRVYRQAGDDGFIALLGRLRVGAATAAELEELQRRCAPRAGPADAPDPGPGMGASAPPPPAVLSTRLFTHRADVDAVNAAALAALPGPGRTFHARDEGAPSEALDAACPARASLELRAGAQVMLLRSLAPREGLVNGARGVVAGFDAARGLPVVAFAAGPTRVVAPERWTLRSGGRGGAAREALPLGLAWALSVHRCQGMSLDAVEVDLARAFEPGMAYVALSRVRGAAGLTIAPGGIAPAALRADPAVLQFYEHLLSTRGGAVLEEDKEADTASTPPPPPSRGSKAPAGGATMGARRTPLNLR